MHFTLKTTPLVRACTTKVTSRQLHNESESQLV